MIVHFGCGCQAHVDDVVVDSPRCAVHQDRRVTAVQVRPPRFRGLCQGPYAEWYAVDPCPTALTDQPRPEITSEKSEA